MSGVFTLPVLIGAGAALCSITSFIPQIVKIIRERNAESVSLRMYVLTVAAFALWTTYGVMLGAWPLVASNVACLICAGTALWCKWRFRDGEPD